MSGAAPVRADGPIRRTKPDSAQRAAHPADPIVERGLIAVRREGEDQHGRGRGHQDGDGDGRDDTRRALWIADIARAREVGPGRRTDPCPTCPR